MSLLDALLLDPYRINVWIAYRTDGVKGSGTEEDPYNGSPRYESAISVSGLTSSGREATATTGGNHGFSDGDVVTISGVTGVDGQYYNGTFVIYGKTATTFKYWMKGSPAGNGSGTMVCALTHYQFDEIRGVLGANTTIHLGPGVFPTQGIGSDGSGVPVLTGQKIIGSGIDVTIVKLVSVRSPIVQYWVLGTGAHLEYFAVSDLTLDCNLDGQLIGSYTFPPIACSGVLVSGAHVKYRRVRVINFGDSSGAFECFVMWSAGADPNPAFVESVDCLMEDCILEQPAINQYGLVTVINMGATEDAKGVMGYHRACVVRNCLIDCEYKINPVAISQISYIVINPGPNQTIEATVTTRVAHGRAVNDWVRISGALVNGSLANAFNGSFKVTAVP
ncbi:MAG TPA: hypothetical protein VN887_04230, partial [Candidatus Angelobacter sp.]|nr:hypothetical protein [Candidatus Angelobacter sp.]